MKNPFMDGIMFELSKSAALFHRLVTTSRLDRSTPVLRSLQKSVPSLGKSMNLKGSDGLKMPLG